MPILSDIGAFARVQAQTDSNGLSNTNLIVFANEALVDFHRKLVAKGVDASQLQEVYRDGTLNTGTYLYPTDMLFLKTIELNYASTTPEGYIQAQQVDIANLAGQNSFGWLRQNARTSSPQFDDRGDWYEIFPTPTGSHNISQLIRLFYFLKPNEYTATGDTIAYPESQDYRILGWRIASSYLYSLGKIDEGLAFNGKYEERVREYIATLSRGTQQPMQATAIQSGGWNF